MTFRSLGAALADHAAAVEGDAQVAYRRYLDHAQPCPNCTTEPCPAGAPLWAAYRAARAATP
ncbi:hypothetical protein ACIP9H_29270 [Streptomyces sp. NPDC088732]|uniref:hypothetical protein n=1 Tax=Streptomyces sp. NPDC088732 TaxID=3365879 RepID=UPI00381DD125